MKECSVAAAEGRQDFSDYRSKFLSVFGSDEIWRALIEKSRPAPIILIEVRDVDVRCWNQLSDCTNNSQPISLVKHHDDCSSSDEVVSDALKRIASPVIRNGLLPVGIHHVAFRKCQGCRNGFSCCQMFIKLPHHHGGKRIVDLPQCGNNAACS